MLHFPTPNVQRLPKPLWSFWTRQLWRTLQPPDGGGGRDLQNDDDNRDRFNNQTRWSSLSKFHSRFLWSSCALPLVFLLSISVCLAESESCPYLCDCKWKGGKETVECQQAGFYMVPKNLPPGTQALDLGRNNLQVLPKDTFMLVGLVHLQKIYLRQCNIIQIDKEAFRSLSNLVELDISDNQLNYVPSWAFREASQLRRLYINNNPLNKIPEDAFTDMPSLEILELSHCQIMSVDGRTFNHVQRLTKLKLDGNYLQNLGGNVVLPLTTLNELHLDGNPWKCDCHLRSLREWMTTKNVPYNVPPTCSMPSRFKGMTWNELQISDYVCEPVVTLPITSIDVVEGENVTLTCYANGNPESSVWWTWQGRFLGNATMIGEHYFIEEEGTLNKSSNLTIMLIEKNDSGVYGCWAESSAGIHGANLTLTVGREATEMKGLAASHITGIVVGIAVVIILIIIVLCVLALKCKLVPKEEHHKVDSNHKMINSASHLRGLEEQDLSLLGPNPIQKPPRLGQYQSVPTVDLDQYDKEFMPNNAPVAWKTQVVVELTKEMEDDPQTRSFKSKVYTQPNTTETVGLYRGKNQDEDDDDDDDEYENRFKDTSLKPIVEEVGFGEGRESEEGDDSGLELDRGRETELRSDVDSDKERLQEKNRRNREKRAPICLRDPSPIEKELIGGIPDLTRDKLLPNKPPVQRGGSTGGGDSTCSSSDPPTVPSSPQRQPHLLPTDAKVMSLMVPSVLLTRARNDRLSSFEDEGEDGTEV